MDNYTSLFILEQQLVTCEHCPRLTAYRQEVAAIKRRAYRDQEYWGKPVPGWGDPGAKLLVLGLAPGAHGANRTGRMFTGDGSGDFLFAALHRAGFASQPESHDPDDGLLLCDVYLSNVVRCAPPQNKPLPKEISACLGYLSAEIQLLPNLKVILALGKIAFDAILTLLIQPGYPIKTPRPHFTHNQYLALASLAVISAYHPSRRNTQTGRLTPEMMDDVLRTCRQFLEN